jgi:hypothetical protein
MVGIYFANSLMEMDGCDERTTYIVWMQYSMRPKGDKDE